MPETVTGYTKSGTKVTVSKELAEKMGLKAEAPKAPAAKKPAAKKPAAKAEAEAPVKE